MWESMNHHVFNQASTDLFQPLDREGRPFIFDLQLHEQVHLEPQATAQMPQADYDAHYFYCSLLAAVRTKIRPVSIDRGTAELRCAAECYGTLRFRAFSLAS